MCAFNRQDENGLSFAQSDADGDDDSCNTGNRNQGRGGRGGRGGRNPGRGRGGRGRGSGEHQTHAIDNNNADSDAYSDTPASVSPPPTVHQTFASDAGIPFPEGFFRNGCCDTCDQDVGSHTVCAVMTDEFLEYSKSVGNDLSTPRPEFGFSGLNAGDQWCLCAARFLQAWQAGQAPRVRLLSTHKRALEIVPLDVLRASAVERN